MGIVPISGIPALPTQPDRTESGVSGVFRVEFDRQQQDSYSPHREGTDRGLEDEQTHLGKQEPESSELQAAPDPAESENQISFFA